MLGLLVHRDGYAYSLEKQLDERAALLGRAPGTACKGVYRAVNRLLAEGLIEESGKKRVGGSHRGSPRVWYTATGGGREAHGAWMESDLDEEAPGDDLRKRLAVATSTDLETLLSVVERDTKRCVDQLLGLARPALAEVTEQALPLSEATMLLAGDAVAHHLQAHVAWLETVHAVLTHQLGGETAE